MSLNIQHFGEWNSEKVCIIGVPTASDMIGVCGSWQITV